MNTLDEQFRADLAEALDASAHDVAPFDTSLLVDAGARKVRQRRAAAGAGMAAGVIALAGGGWAVLNQPRQPQVAAPAPTVTPAPIPSVARDTTARLVVPGAEGSYEVTIQAGDPLVVGFAQVIDGTVSGVEKRQFPSGMSLVGQGTVDGQVVLGVVPREAVRVNLLENGNAGGHGGVVLADLPGTAWKAFGVRLDMAPMAGEPITAMWWRADGTPVSDNGAGHGATIRDGEDSHLVWALPAENAVGLDGPHGGMTTSPGNVADGRITVLSGGMWVTNQVDNTYGGDYFYALIVRGTAIDAQAAWDDDRIVDERIIEQPWPEMDSTIVVVSATLPQQHGPQPDGGPIGLTGLTWTDADGVRQEWKN